MYPPVRLEQRDSYCTDFHEIPYLGFSLKYVDKFRFRLKKDKNDGISREDLRTFRLFLRDRCVLFEVRPDELNLTIDHDRI
jgi:hypothetical protein